MAKIIKNDVIYGSTDAADIKCTAKDGTSTNVQAIITSHRTIYTGTEEPSSSLGVNGDIYIKFES